jgi:hypothetical protein
MLFFVIGCVGLAVDVGTIYMIKARLSAAVDAAALAAGRSVNLASTLPPRRPMPSPPPISSSRRTFPTGIQHASERPP